MIDDMAIPTGLRALADAQDGLVTRRQALAAGMSNAAIRHAIGPGGQWQKIVSGIYATFTGAISHRNRVRAAVLYAGPQAVVTGAYACRAHGLDYAPGRAIVILVPPGVRRAPIDIATIRRVATMPTSRILRGIPCTAPERAALDASREAKTLRDARAILCEVVQRALTTPERLIAEFDRMDTRGMRLAKQALEDVSAGCRSAPECELRDLIRTSTVLSEPVWTTPLPDADDLIPDGHYEEARVALEVDSIEWHQLGVAPADTEKRRAKYANLGWRVVPISPRRLRQEPEDVLKEIEQAVRRGLDDAA
jgi:hypothetical protein